MSEAADLREFSNFSQDNSADSQEKELRAVLGPQLQDLAIAYDDLESELEDIEDVLVRFLHLHAVRPVLTASFLTPLLTIMCAVATGVET